MHKNQPFSSNRTRLFFLNTLVNSSMDLNSVEHRKTICCPVKQ